MDRDECWFREITELTSHLVFTKQLYEDTITLARELRDFSEVRILRRKIREIETIYLNELRRIQNEMRNQ